MITFFVCLFLLILSYFTYAKYLERTMEVDPANPVPSKTHFDGVDYVPMPKWKTFLIQLLNIAGLGPIFGALLGATYGPVAFLWITLGGIFFGAMHDYMAGMISLRNNGLSFPEIVGKYLGRNIKQVMRVFTIFLMILVGAVFMVGPAGILEGLTGMSTSTWVWIILVYYILATLLPIDAIIGRIYPLFGAALIFMAVGIFSAVVFQGFTIPELTPATMTNMKIDADKFPLIPTLFITIACGAISGFHCTQSPLVARCITNERQGRGVFFGAMISESIIALIWAAIGMAFFGGVRELNEQLAANGNNAGWAIDMISRTTLGKVGGIIALIGVVVAPITSGDTAFRSARLIVADFLGIEQKSLRKRILICIPLFAIGFAITLMPFDVVWRYFAWANQTLAVAALWTITVFLWLKRKNIYISLIPGLFMTFITSTYFFTGYEMLRVNYTLGCILGAAVTLMILGFFIYYTQNRCNNRE